MGCTSRSIGDHGNCLADIGISSLGDAPWWMLSYDFRRRRMGKARSPQRHLCVSNRLQVRGFCAEKTTLLLRDPRRMNRRPLSVRNLRRVRR